MIKFDTNIYKNISLIIIPYKKDSKSIDIIFRVTKYNKSLNSLLGWLSLFVIKQTNTRKTIVDKCVSIKAIQKVKFCITSTDASYPFFDK